MRNTVSTMRQVATLSNNINSLKKQYKCLDKLKKMENKTDLEINALKGLRRSLTCKWIVAIIFTITLCCGICIFLKGMETKEAILGDYDVETSYVKEGYIRYGRDDKEYYVGDQGYEENTWLYILLDKESGEVENVKSMNAVNEEAEEKQIQIFTQAGVILGASFIVLFLGLFLALGIFEKPFRKWYTVYTSEHPGWYDKL